MTPRDPGWSRWLPLGLVAVAVVFNLVALRAETTPVLAANDTEQHVLMVNWAHDRIADGHNPLDGWYPYLGLGSPHFRHYQSFPHIVAGAIGNFLGPVRVYFWTLYLLLALWPICVYVSGRLFGASRWVCAWAAVVSLLVASYRPNALGFEFAAYSRGGFGVWAQLWGMWLLPPTLALAWRAVHRGGSYPLAGMSLALLIASHFLTGYLALIIIGVWVLISRRDIPKRIGRTAVVVFVTLIVGGWAIIPPLLDARWALRQEQLLNTVYTDSYGPGQVLAWLVGGEIFDAGRLPVITLLVFVGVGVCIARRKDDRARALLSLGALSLILYMGRSVVGIVLDRLPIGGDILLHRYIAGVHLAGIFFAGIGAVWLGDSVIRYVIKDGRAVRRLRASQRANAVAIVVVLLGFLVLIPAYRERWTFTQQAAASVAAQQAAEREDGGALRSLVEVAKRRRDGRLSAGMSTGQGDSIRLGSAFVYEALARYEADAVGYKERTLSLMSTIEGDFVDLRERDRDLFNVRYLIRPRGFPQLGNLEKVMSRGDFTLWEAKTSGYLDVIDTYGTVSADRSNVRARTMHVLSPSFPGGKTLPTVAFDGRAAATPTADRIPESSPGKVIDQEADPYEGRFSGTVDVRRRSVVLLKSSFDPRWRISVDGKRVKPEMIAPALVGATVEPGRHSVRFEYVPLPYYGALIALALVGLVVFGAAERYAKGRRSRERTAATL